MRDSIMCRPVYAPLARRSLARTPAVPIKYWPHFVWCQTSAAVVAGASCMRPAAQQVLRVQFADGYAHSKGALTTLHEAALWDGQRSRFGTYTKRSLPAEALPAIYFFALGTALA